MALSKLEETALDALRLAKTVIGDLAGWVVDPMLSVRVQPIKDAIEMLEEKQRTPEPPVLSGGLAT